MPIFINIDFVYFILLILIGYLLRSTGTITAKGRDSLTKIVIYVTLPAIILNTIPGIEIDPSMLILPVIGALYGALVFLAGLFFFRREPRRIKGVMLLSLLGLNIGLFSLPFVEALWGNGGVQSILMIDLGNSLVVFGLAHAVAILFSEENGDIGYGRIISRTFRFLPFLSYIAALALNILNIGIPSPAAGFFDMLNAANKPLVLMIIGMYMEVPGGGAEWGRVYRIIAIRYVVGALTGAILYFLLPIDILQRRVIWLSLVMPIAMAVIAYSVEYDLDQRIAGRAVNITILLSFLIVMLISIFP